MNFEDLTIRFFLNDYHLRQIGLIVLFFGYSYVFGHFSQLEYQRVPRDIEEEFQNIRNVHRQ